MHVAKKETQTNGRFVAAIGAATASAWLLSGTAMPVEHLTSGLEMVRNISGHEIDLNMVDSFMQGGRDHLAAIGMGLAESAQTAGLKLCEKITAPLAEMRLHLGDRLVEVKAALESRMSFGEDRAAFWLHQAGFAHSQEDAMEVVDAGKGMLDALHGIVKAWTVFTLASHAIRWGVAKLRGIAAEDVISEDAAPEDAAPEAAMPGGKGVLRPEARVLEIPSASPPEPANLPLPPAPQAEEIESGEMEDCEARP